MRSVTIFGGSGFVGRYIVQKLAKKGYRIQVAVRNPIAAQFLKPLGEVGQITPIQASILNPKDVARAIEGADVVINLVGILFEKSRQTFEAVHVEGAEQIAKTAAQMGIKTLLHMSALGADKASRSKYAMTKARGEEAVLKYFPQATILRPSVIFGPEDAFLNRFAEMALLSPVLPLIGGGKTRFQPIYVEDVADAYLAATYLKEAQGKTYELGGPSVYTFRELMIYLLQTIQRKRLLLPLPFGLAKFMATFAQLLPRPPLTRDQVELLKTDNVVSPSALSIEKLGVGPKALEAMGSLYLQRYCSKRKGL